MKQGKIYCITFAKYLVNKILSYKLYYFFQSVAKYKEIKEGLQWKVVSKPLQRFIFIKEEKF